jgi:formate hydrogenlyase transcriptional activator
VIERKDPTMAVIVHEGKAPATSEPYRALLAVAEGLVAQRDLDALFADLAARLRQVVRFDGVHLRLHHPTSDTLRLHVREGLPPIPPPLVEVPTGDHPAGWVWQSQQPLIVSNLAAEPRWPRCIEQDHEVGGSLCLLPLTTARARLGTLALRCVEPAAYDEEDLDFLREVANLVALAVENALAFGRIQERSAKSEKEKVYLQEEIHGEHDFEEIIGQSHALRLVLKAVEAVAPTSATVLICGETGTGKELIARALHQLSPRRERTFVKVNCAAIPTGLLESELFGHEKGAFTGAIAQKVGRFELAHQGTLFLDEVGDIPLELQPKLLRVLQEHELERLGSNRTLRVDVRLVAATNRDLLRMVADGHFRRDLYYRLNVFPVYLPPLRERRDDIPRLARAFTQRFARRLGREIEVIPAEAMDALVRYDWPGNIRELENVIERAVILSPGPALRIPVHDVEVLAGPGGAAGRGAPTLADAERERILSALRQANWVVGGPKGAAARLGVHRSFLQRKMKKLGISRSE